MSAYQFGESIMTSAHHTEVHHLRDDVVWPISGDATAQAHTPFTPSAGNLWAQPGVHQATHNGVLRVQIRADKNRVVRAND